METFRITNTNHRNLDGIRAIGILMVITKHFYGSFMNVSVLWTSIDLLFVLSGLLITGILIETKSDPAYFKKFYMRRILRIFPLYYLLILLFAVFIYLITNHPEAFNYFKDNIIYFLTYTQNWYFISHGMPEAGHLNHTWTLAIDEQIYIFWPMLIWLCKNQKHLIALCLTILIFSLLFRMGYIAHLKVAGSPNSAPYFYNTFCRLDSFAAGSLLYCLLRFVPHLISTKIMLAFLLGSGVLFLFFGVGDGSFNLYGPFMSNYGITVIGIHFTCWVYFAARRSFVLLNIFLSNRVLVYIGKISYSLYVFHWFLLILLFSKIEQILKLPGPLTAGLCLGITFIVSILSYTFFEKPIIGIKKKFSYRTASLQQESPPL